MTRKRTSMRKIREIMRLYFKCELSFRAIADICSMSHSSVIDCLNRVKEKLISWPLPDDINDDMLEELLYPPKTVDVKDDNIPDFEYIHKELKRKGVTIMLLWKEYKECNPEGYQYSHYCGMYRKWAAKSNIWMRQPHKAGEKLFIDYAGLTIPIENSNGNIKAQIFVSTLGASNYTYIEATASQSLINWISSHVRAFNFFGGVPEILVPDNLKSGVKKSNLYEPDINFTYSEFAKYYGTYIIPARVRKPKDKSKVEKSVKDIEQQILATIRNHPFFSILELNKYLHKLLLEFNNRPFQKIKGSRSSCFEEIDKPALKPLPQIPYVYGEWRKIHVGSDYHISVEGHYYSVPYKYAGSNVNVMISANVIEIFNKNQRIASHIRSNEEGKQSTQREHLSPAHLHYKECTSEKLIDKAKQVGLKCEALITNILKNSLRHLQQREKTCLGILRLEKSYGAVRLDNACNRALQINAYTFRSIKSILKNNLDGQKVLLKKEEILLPQKHDHVRGSQYYEEI